MTMMTSEEFEQKMIDLNYHYRVEGAVVHAQYYTAWIKLWWHIYQTASVDARDEIKAAIERNIAGLKRTISSYQEEVRRAS